VSVFVRDKEVFGEVFIYWQGWMVHYAEWSQKTLANCLSRFAFRIRVTVWCNASEIMLVILTMKIIAAAKPVEVPGLFVRIIPSAKAIFSVAKLNLKRNNIH